MSNKPKPANAGFVVRGVAAAVALACAGGAHAFQVDTGNPDLRVRFDNTVRYTLGTRIEGQDQGLMRNYVYDEGDSKFDRGDVVTNRLDLLSELDVSYRNQFGARVSAALWYDKAYDDHDVRSPAGRPTAYVNDQYNGEVKRFVNGPSGEFLDAFIWGNFEFGSVPLNVKLGRQTNVWGEGLLIGAHAISYGQSPVDGVKAVTNPGIETKEVFLPLNQVHLSAQVTDSVTLVGQYFLDWKPTRVPHAGTYLMGADTAPSSDYLVYPATTNHTRTKNAPPSGSSNARAICAPFAKAMSTSRRRKSCVICLPGAFARCRSSTAFRCYWRMTGKMRAGRRRPCWRLE